MALTFGLVSGYREQPSAAADWRCLRSPGIASPRHPWEMKPPSSYPSSSAAQRPLGPPFLPRFTLHSTACNPRTELNSFSTSRPRGAPLPPMTNSFFLSLPFFLCSLEPKLKLVFEKWESSTDTLVTLVSTFSCYRLWLFSRRMTFLLFSLSLTVRLNNSHCVSRGTIFDVRLFISCITLGERRQKSFFTMCYISKQGHRQSETAASQEILSNPPPPPCTTLPRAVWKASQHKGQTVKALPPGLGPSFNSHYGGHCRQGEEKKGNRQQMQSKTKGRRRSKEGKRTPGGHWSFIKTHWWIHQHKGIPIIFSRGAMKKMVSQQKNALLRSYTKYLDKTTGLWSQAFSEHNTSRLRFPTIPNGRNKTSLSRRDLWPANDQVIEGQLPEIKCISRDA